MRKDGYTIMYLEEMFGLSREHALMVLAMPEPSRSLKINELASWRACGGKITIGG